MTSESAKSGSQIIFELLKMIWAPAFEAAQIQMRSNVRLLAETSEAAKGAGCEVYYVDLPDRVSGFVDRIGDEPHIVINRAKSPEHQQYTLLHELGHKVLHLNPSDTLLGQPALESKEIAEFQAHMFAVAWILTCVADSKKGQEVLKQNPESSIVVLFAAFMTALILGVGLVVFLWSRLSRARLPNAMEQK